MGEIDPSVPESKEGFCHSAHKQVSYHVIVLILASALALGQALWCHHKPVLQLNVGGSVRL